MLGGQAVGLDDDQMGRALAVGGDAAGHVDADVLDETGESRLVLLGLDLDAGGARWPSRIMVSLVEVSPSTVHILKLLSMALCSIFCRSSGRALGVGGDIGEGGGHVGVDHAAALGHRADADGAGGELELVGGFLADGVGGHDGIGRVGARWPCRAWRG